MSITSSTFAAGTAQKDGRVWITETHIDSVVGALLFSYLAADSSNATAVMNARVASINEQLAAAEAVNLVDNAVPFVLQQNNATQFAARVRARYHDDSGFDCARIAEWLMDRLDDGTFTVAQLRTAFSLTLAQWNTLQTKMQGFRTAYQNALAAAGE